MPAMRTQTFPANNKKPSQAPSQAPPQTQFQYALSSSGSNSSDKEPTSLDEIGRNICNGALQELRYDIQFLGQTHVERSLDLSASLSNCHPQCSGQDPYHPHNSSESLYNADTSSSLPPITTEPVLHPNWHYQPNAFIDIPIMQSLPPCEQWPVAHPPLYPNIPSIPSGNPTLFDLFSEFDLAALGLFPPKFDSPQLYHNQLDANNLFSIIQESKVVCPTDISPLPSVPTQPVTLYEPVLSAKCNSVLGKAKTPEQLFPGDKPINVQRRRLLQNLINFIEVTPVDIRNYFSIQSATGSKPYSSGSSTSDNYSSGEDQDNHRHHRDGPIRNRNRTKGQSKDLCCAVPGCQHSFSRVDRLKTHLNYHLGVRPYPCNRTCGDEACNRAFQSRADLEAYIKKTDSKETCERCGDTYTLKNKTRHEGSQKCQARGLRRTA